MKIAVQDYDFDIAYIEGEANVVADPLSRLCPRSLSADEEAEVETNYRIDSLEISNFHSIEVQPIRERKQYFVNKKNQTAFNSLQVELNSQVTKRLPYIPQFAHEILSQCHNSIVGHFGRESTLQRVMVHLENNPEKYQDLHWPSKRQDIATFIQKCPCCQKMTQMKLDVFTDKYTTSTFGIFQNISIDAIYMPPSQNGNKYILTLIDSFTRYTELYSIKDLTAKAAFDCLVHYMSTYGIPNQICSDNSSQFEGIFAEMLQLCNIHNYKIHPYSHEENSIVERANKEINRHLRNLVFDKKIKQDWDIVLPLIKRILNSKVHQSTGIAPVEIVFAGQVDLNNGILFHRSNAVQSIPMNEYLNKIYTHQDTLLNTAYKNQDETDLLHMTSLQGRVTEFPLLSYVLVNPEMGPLDKLSVRRRGPYQIINRTVRKQGDIYTCQHLANNKVEDFHVKLLTAFEYDDTRTSPIEVSTHDDEYHIVDAVLGHRFKKIRSNKTKDLQLKIKWLGDESPLWCDYNTTLKKVEKVHDYLYNHKLVIHVPAAFKRPQTIENTIDDVARKRVRYEESIDANQPSAPQHHNKRFSHGKTTKVTIQSSSSRRKKSRVN